MFGQNNQPGDDNNPIPDHSIDGVISAASDSGQSSGQPAQDWGHPGTPLGERHDQPETTAPTDEDAPADDHVDHAGHNAPTDDDSHNDLIDIKQQALNQLAPLVDHLEQSPEERFRTTMMMIQASDNQTLVRSAYEAALAIPDEKVRAQALLDVVNEINYFTQQQEQ